MVDKKGKFKVWLDSIENTFLTEDLEQIEARLAASTDCVPRTQEQRLITDFIKIRRHWYSGDLNITLKHLQKFLKRPELKTGSSIWTDAMILNAHICYANAQITTSEKILKKIKNTMDEASPLWPDINFNLASIAQSKGLISDALNRLKEIIGFSKSTPELITRAALAAAKIKSDMYMEGVEEYTKIVMEKAPKWGGWNAIKTAGVLKALSDFREGSYGVTIKELYRHMQESDESNFIEAAIRARLALAETLLTLGDYSSAKDLLSEIDDILKNVQISDLKNLQNQAEFLWYMTDIRQEEQINSLWGALDRIEILLAVIAKYPRPPGPAPFWLLLGEIQSKLGLNDAAIRSFQRTQSEAEAIGSILLNMAARYALANLKWQSLTDNEKAQTGFRNKILSETTQILDVSSSSKYSEFEWKIHFLRGEIFENSGEQYPAKEEMKLAAQIVKNLILSIENPSLQTMYRQTQNRHKALLHLQSFSDLIPSETPPSINTIQPVTQKALPGVIDISQSRILDDILQAMLDIHSVNSVSALFDALQRYSLQTIDGDRAEIIVFDQEKGYEAHGAKFRSSNDQSSAYFIPEKWLLEAASGTQIMTFFWDINDFNDHPRFLLIAPLYDKTVLKALLCIDRIQRKGDFTDEDRTILSTLISVASVAYSTLASREKLTKLSDQLRREIIPEFPDIIGQSEAMKKVFVQMQKIASSDIPVVIVGETGTGKDLIARTIHSIGNRSQAPFIHLDCSAIPATLLESELFGIADGVATGVESRVGLIEYAHDGTILLNEVGDIPLSTQAKLLRVLQEKEFISVGTYNSVSVNVRVLSTSTENLETLIQKEKLREDFYYRINGLTIELPPLRDRAADIVLLARTFLQQFNLEFKKQISGFDPSVFDAMKAYDWPGNIRELEHMLRRAVLLCKGDRITLQDMNLPETQVKKVTLNEAIHQMEISSAKEAFNLSKRKAKDAAKALNISVKKLEQLLSTSG